MERTLLLVDDEPNILSSLVRVLRRDGYTILRANSGAEGLTILSETPVDVIVSDHRMPEMTGVEFLHQARSVQPDAVRIVLSGYTELEAVTEAINRGGVFRFLTKPWEDEMLRATVREAFDYHELRVENSLLQEKLAAANAQLMDLNVTLSHQVADTAERASFQAEALRGFQELVESLPIPVIGVADDGMIAVSNRAADVLFMPDGGSLVSCVGDMVLPASVRRLFAHPQEPVDVTLPGPESGEVTLHAHAKRLEGDGVNRGTLLTLLP